MAILQSVFDVLKEQNAVVGQGYIISLPPLVVDDGEKVVMWLTNTDPVLNMHINKFVFALQTAVNNPKLLQVETRLYQGTTQPTANHTQLFAGPLDSGSAFVPPILAYGWNGVGAGMTVASLGFYGGSLVNIPGLSEFDAQGSSIVAPGGAFSLACMKNPFSDAAKVSMFITGYFRKDFQ